MRKTKAESNGSASGLDAIQSAKEAGLRYVSDETPGISRVRSGKGFRYRDDGGKPVRNRETLARIKSLVIPPAWTEVWISPIPNGHLQATGRDARRRKQYKYHPRWREQRDDEKYGHLIAFAERLPKIRRRVNRDLKRRGLPREKAISAVLKLLETTLIRVGNDEYARTNESFGLTTILNKHVDVRGTRVRFEFRGKSGVEHEVELSDRRLARIIRQWQELPGQELVEYVDDEGNVRDVDSADVNDYLREIAGEEFTAKDFRTWAGTVLAAQALQEFEDFDSQAAAKRNITRAIERVAERLGNTKAVCRKCYVHPEIFNAYLDKSLTVDLKRRAERELRNSLNSLPSAETAVLALLQQRFERELEAPRAKSAAKRTTPRQARRKPSARVA